MASLTDSPALTAARQSARVQQSLLNRQYRYAKRRGDFGEALKALRAGEEMGLPIGRPVHSEELDAVGEAMYNFDSARLGMEPQGGGLDSFDSRHSNDGGPGVGGYSFGQRRNRQRPMLSRFADILNDPMDNQMDERMGFSADPGVTSAMTQQPRQATAGTFYGDPDRRAAFSRAWQYAKTQDERDALVEKADSLGVQMNPELAGQAFTRLGKSRRPRPSSLL